MKHVMHDLETLDVVPGAAILSIGAVEFDPSTAKLGRTFYQVISLGSYLDAGLTVSPGTLRWWMQQSDAARQVFTDPGAVELDSALHGFNVWLDDVRADDELNLWGNGSNFDNVLLREAYETLGIVPAWSPFEDRCYRTLKNLFPHIEMARSGTHHNALDDACTQARHAIDLLRAVQQLKGGAW